MPATLTFALALMGLACLMSALAPAWVLLRPQRQVPDTVGAARVGLFGTSLIVIVALSWFAGISFSVGPANVLLVLAALIAGLLLSVMAFFCRPSFLGGTVGLIGGAAWLLMLGLAIMIGPSFSSDPALSLGDGN